MIFDIDIYKMSVTLLTVQSVNQYHGLLQPITVEYLHKIFAVAFYNVLYEFLLEYVSLTDIFFLLDRGNRIYIWFVLLLC